MSSIRTRVPLLLLVAAGCAGAQPVRPVSVSIAAHPADAVDGVIRVLAQDGFTTARVDEQAGVVESAWQPTQFMYGQNHAKETRYIARRVLVTISAQGDGSQVLVQMQDTACVNATAFAAGDPTYADCVAVDGVVPPDQELLDRVGADLAAAYGVLVPSRP